MSFATQRTQHHTTLAFYLCLPALLGLRSEERVTALCLTFRKTDNIASVPYHLTSHVSVLTNPINTQLILFSTHIFILALHEENNRINNAICFNQNLSTGKLMLLFTVNILYITISGHYWSTIGQRVFTESSTSLHLALLSSTLLR